MRADLPPHGTSLRRDIIPGLVLIALYQLATPHILWPYSVPLLGSHLRQAFTEGPLLVLVLYLLTRPLKKGLRGTLSATAVVLLVYAVHDAHYAVLGTVPDFVDIAQVPDLALVVGWPTTLAVLLVAALPVASWVACWDRDIVRSLRWVPTSWSSALAAAPLVLLAVLFVASPTTSVRLMRSVAPAPDQWATKVEAESSGRLWAALVRNAERRSIVAQTRDAASVADAGLAWSDDLTHALHPRNVYLVVLESFVDPSLFTRVGFDRSPWSDSFVRVTAGHLSVSVSPGVMGGTAGAEFEVLCGVPALELFAAIDFNSFTGQRAPCVPEQLRERGYRTRMFSAGDAMFYNSRRAYRSAGFDEIAFANTTALGGDASFYQDYESDPHRVDETLYKHALLGVAPVPPAGRPTFTYLVTMYGHWPFGRDTTAQPDVVSPDVADPVVRRLANIAYYRSRALQSFLDSLERHDPEALVIAIGDHLPPLGLERYADLGYVGRAFPGDERMFRETALLVRDGGDFRQFPPGRHFQLRSIIYDALTGGAFCREQPESCVRRVTSSTDERAVHLAAYRTVIALGSAGADSPQPMGATGAPVR